MNTSLRDGIDWTGYVDWTIRDFHGYRTERGSSYNAYLVRDKKTALIDTVKAPYVDHLIERVRSLTEGTGPDYVVCNHAEPDHSGGLPAVLRAFPSATVICNAKCRDALALHYDTAEWNVQVVADGESLSLGARSLVFINTPMVHWPESMFTYVPEERLLFSMDAFGQHLASAYRFDDETDLDVVLAEAKTYYANIVMLYGRPIESALSRAATLDLDMIAPSHGVIWRKNLPAILDAYTHWVHCRPTPKVVVIYDTMWKSTEIMARTIVEGAQESGADVRLLNVRASNMTTVATEVLDAAAIAVGSPTLNRTLMPQVAAVLTYLKGLRPTGKVGFSFGSYGWSKGGARDVQKYLEDTRVDLLREPIEAKFVPDEACLDDCRAAGRMLGEKAVAAASSTND